MPHGPIAELIRTRAGDSAVDQDVVVCLAEHEAELLARRPDLATKRRCETRHISPAVVLFFPGSDRSTLHAGRPGVAVDRHV